MRVPVRNAVFPYLLRYFWPIVPNVKLVLIPADQNFCAVSRCCSYILPFLFHSGEGIAAFPAVAMARLANKPWYLTTVIAPVVC